MENADLPKCFSCLKKPASAIDALAQHMSRSATGMTKQDSAVPNHKTKQDLKKSSSVQKAWPDSIIGNSAAANLFDCGNFILCVICNRKINRKPPFVERGRWKAHKETNAHVMLSEKRPDKK